MSYVNESRDGDQSAGIPLTPLKKLASGLGISQLREVSGDELPASGPGGMTSRLMLAKLFQGTYGLSDGSPSDHVAAFHARLFSSDPSADVIIVDPSVAPFDYGDSAKAGVLSRMPAPSAMEQRLISVDDFADFYYWGSVPEPADDEWAIALELCDGPYHWDLKLALLLGVLMNNSIDDTKAQTVVRMLDRVLERAEIDIGDRKTLAATLRSYFSERVAEMERGEH